jgi:hypothetical protein
MSGKKIQNILIIFTDFISPFCKPSKKYKILPPTGLKIGGFGVQEASVIVFRVKIAAIRIGHLKRVIGRVFELFHRSKQKVNT